ncbi:ABC transporter transmembrane region/ABC transporter, putative [Angomonas deanei]|uniref:ABC transporter transmembrane region/ABC transporter, putative n=1 Tax=Angomonas deanei TaxID=59799 RepID=A0A7G2C9T0_9TRYP|nr:ABC transporter transmembrane region/ABC transporter, putative [Angomonas deanei]
MMLDGSVITGIVTSNAKLCGNSVARFLTDVLYLCLSVIGLAGMLIFLSCRLTLIIGVLIVSVQLFYLFAGKSNRKKGTEVNHAETTAHSYLTNAIRRSETISIFNCAPFVVDRLESTFADLQRLSSSLNFSIHGYAALSSGSTNLIFVIVLVLANYYHRQGSLELTDIAMYFMLFQSFVRTLSYLAEEANSFRSMINGTAVLYQLMNWYQEVRVPAEGDDKRVCFIPEEDTTTPVELKAVAFAYPEIPSFLETQFQSLSTVGGEELKTKKGITDISFSVPQHSITVLFGQSGCGKSTSLRILGGILQPSGGTVNTRKNAILLEQQHAIFFGSVAENIMLKDLSLCADEHTERVQKACAKGGCDVFIKNPFREMISNTDKPPFSGGQLQRICLARLFANCDDCSLILFDEPTTGLDATRVKSLLETISLLRDTYKKTVVIASHDERVLNFADHVVTFK